jgi:hypothetical protein
MVTFRGSKAAIAKSQTSEIGKVQRWVRAERITGFKNTALPWIRRQTMHLLLRSFLLATAAQIGRGQE